MAPLKASPTSPAIKTVPKAALSCCLLSLLLLGVTATQLADAQIYRWKDANGKFQYSDKPKPGAELIVEPKAAVIKPLRDSASPSDLERAAVIEEETSSVRPGAEQEEAAAGSEQADIAAPKAQRTSKTIALPKQREAMSTADKDRLKELSRKHKKCASSRNRLNTLEAQYQQRKLEAAPSQTLDYLQRSISRQTQIVSRDCA